MYNFGIVTSVPGNTLNRNNVTLYIWTEDEHRKGANEIASAVFNTLQNIAYNKNIKTVPTGGGWMRCPEQKQHYGRYVR